MMAAQARWYKCGRCGSLTEWDFELLGDEVRCRHCFDAESASLNEVMWRRRLTQRRYRGRHLEESRESCRRHYWSNRDRLLAKAQVYKDRHRAKLRTASKLYMRDYRARRKLSSTFYRRHSLSGS